MENTLTEKLIDAAKSEGKITPLSLLQELEPLINEYFVTELNYADESIVLSFYNGQRFALKAAEE